MRSYAIVIGVDRYANPDWNLAGATSDALRFAQWALDAGGVERANLRLLLSGDVDSELAFTAADSRNIRGVIHEFVNGLGKDEQRLYFYYAGHGLSAPGAARGDTQEPVLIPADVESIQRDSNLFVGFSDIMPLLGAVGPREQFFFLDACRDFALEDHRPGLGRAVGPYRPRGEDGATRAQYVLYATAPGKRAQEQEALRQGVFGGALLAGLRGAPAATRYNAAAERYEVSFSRLSQYVIAEVQDRIRNVRLTDWERYVQVPESLVVRGDDTPVLASVSRADMPRLPVTLTVSPSQARQTCAVRLLVPSPEGGIPVRNGTVDPPLDRTVKLSVLPFDYALEAHAAGYAPQRTPFPVWRERVEDLPPLKKAEEPVVEGTPNGGGPGAEGGIAGGAGDALPGPPTGRVGRRVGSGRLEVTCDDPAATIIVYDASRAIRGKGTHEVVLDDLEPAIYTVHLVPVEGQTTDRLVEVLPGSAQAIALDAPGAGIGRDQRGMLERVGIVEDERGFVRPSERADSLANARLGTILAYAALAAQPPGLPGFEHLNDLGVRGLSDLPPGGSGLLTILASSGDDPVPGIPRDQFVGGGEVIVRNLEGETVGQQRFTQLSGMSAAGQAGCTLTPGCVTAELHIPGLAATRYALTALRDRVTVLIAVADDSGSMEVQQYLIPVHGVEQTLDPKGLRRLDVAQRHYERGDLPEAVDGLDDLLEGTWLDPLLGALAGYALLRSGRPDRYIGAPSEGAAVQPSAMRNMLTFFGDLPDSHVLAGLCEPERRDEHFARALDLGLPVFADGFRALHAWYSEPARDHLRPLWVEPSGLLAGSTWTAWVAERPAIRVTGATFGPTPPGWGMLESQRDPIERSLAAVGLVRGSGPEIPVTGTAFAVAPGVIMTMEFVCPPDADPAKLSIDFAAEPGTGGSGFAVRTKLLVIERPEARSLILLGVEEQAQDGRAFPEPLALARNAPRPAEGRPVYVAGYPFADTRVPPDVQSRVFGGVYGVKRLQPGRLLMVEGDDGALLHDCLTLAGNAGSPVVDLETGLVLGVHYAGRWVQFKRGEAVPLWPVAGHEVLARLAVWR